MATVQPQPQLPKAPAPLLQARAQAHAPTHLHLHLHQQPLHHYRNNNNQQQQHNPSQCHPVFFTDKLRRQPPFALAGLPSMSSRHVSPVAQGYAYQDGQRGGQKPRL